MYRVKCREEIHLKHTRMQGFDYCHPHSIQLNLENCRALVLKPWKPISLSNKSIHMVTTIFLKKELESVWSREPGIRIHHQVVCWHPSF